MVREKEIDGWETFTLLPPAELNAEYGSRVHFGYPFALQAALYRYEQGREARFVMFHLDGGRCLYGTAPVIDRW